MQDKSKSELDIIINAQMLRYRKTYIILKGKIRDVSSQQ